MYAGDAPGPGPVGSGWHSRPSNEFAAALRRQDVVAEPVIPEHWRFENLPYVPYNVTGAARAQAVMVQGLPVEAVAGGQGYNIAVNGQYVCGGAGGLYSFKTEAAALKWAEIVKARVLNELRLAQSMTAERRAVWLAKKRASLAKQADMMLRAVMRGCNNPHEVEADATFALTKWSHYA